jgi:UDP-N-acetylmuramoyl-L-alanyl-D-glutamate--2,6-diaminopimelate ligase
VAFSAIKKILPNKAVKKIRPIWHGFLASLATLRYGNPSSRMLVIGVTGTAGKSTTIQMLAEILRAGGMKTGYITTAGFSNGGALSDNLAGLSMPGGFAMQSALLDILDAGCSCAIVECTSEGLAQNRHYGINFDMALLTNIYAAHLEAHGGMEAYRKAKGKLFAALSEGDRKASYPTKFIGVNAEAEHSGYFASFAADEKFAIINGMDEAAIARGVRAEARTMYSVETIDATGEQSTFEIADTKFTLLIPGEFNVWNAALAASAAHMLGIELSVAAQALARFAGVPGRMEELQAENGVRIIIDYAPEPIGMEEALRAVQAMSHERIVHVFGSTGGHRDVAKRGEFAAISARYADSIIITNDDVYDSDPEQIANDIRAGVQSVLEKKPDVKTILDRTEALRYAIQNAKAGDIVLVTGKGSERFLVLPGNKRIEWNERKVVEGLLNDHAKK